MRDGTGNSFFGSGTPRVRASNGVILDGQPFGTSPSNPAADPTADNRDFGPPAVSNSPGALPSVATSVAPSQGAAKRAPVAERPNIPKDAQFTITCDAYSSLEQANNVKRQLIDLTHMRDWYTVTDEKGTTTLYYGYYRENESGTKDGARAHADLRKIQELATADGDHPFKSSIIEHITLKDPLAPAEWDLEKAYNPRFPQDHYWSLQIAAFYDRPDRKELAVEAVRDFRARGIEAYYYHGPSISSVCVGLWPREAVAGDHGENKVSAQNENPEQPIFVSAIPFPKGVSNDMRLADGTQVSPFTVKTEVVDPTLKKMIKEYPNNAVNGVVAHEVINPKTHQKETIPQPSLLVIVPHADEEDKPSAQGENAPPMVPGADFGADSFVPPVAPTPAPGAGRLPGLR
jgi:hypothetical protein